jgi:hypothetical protein
LEVRVLPPELMADGKPPSNVGCVLAIVALPVVILIGVVIGTVLRDDDDGPEETRENVADGEIDGTSYRVGVERDVQGANCIFLFEGDEQISGACGREPQDVTYGDQTVVFGLTDPVTTTAQVELSNGEVVEITTHGAEAIDDHWYVEEVAGDVDAEALVP